MKRYYVFSNALKRNVIQIKPNLKYVDIESSLYYSSTYKLPEETVFRIIKGKNWTDIISNYEYAPALFYISERMVNFFSLYMDMSNCCHLINFAENISEKYYKLYNLQHYELVNPHNFCEKYDEVSYFYLPDDENPPSLFTITERNFCIVDDITFKLMNNQNFSNVYFEEIYSLNKAEYEEWKILHAQHKPLIPRL